MYSYRSPLSVFILAIFLLASCQNPVEEVTWPEDLAGKRSLLEEKRKTLRELQRDITKLEEEISALDPSGSDNRVLVRTTEVVVEPFRHYVEIQANVESDDAVMVSPELSGRIISLPVREGQYVKKGQILAKLDLESINKQIQEVKTSLDLANTVFVRQKRLWEQNIGSEIQYLEAKNNKERLEKTLETLNHQLSKSTVYAPISGEVDQLIMKRGEMAAPGAPILQLLNTSQVKVIADVPEKYLGKVTRGDQVTVRFPALDQERTARVSRIGSTINPNNRTFEVEVMLNNNDRILKPNLLAIMLIQDYAEENAIAIPVELVQEEISGKDYVMMVEKTDEGYFSKKKYVTTGLTQNGKMEIKQGLSGGDQIITDGARGLVENSPINIKNNATAENEGE